MMMSSRTVRLAGLGLGLARRSLTTVRREDGVAHITLNNPATRNSLSLEMMTRLKEDISEAAKDKTVRSIVLRGEGKVFSAGHNLKELTKETSYEEHKAVFAECESLMLLVGKAGLNMMCLVLFSIYKVYDCFYLEMKLTQYLAGEVSVPVVAVVTGHAAAAGCQLVSSCDIVLASHSAQFSTPGASVGLFCHTPGIPLARRVPRAVSGYMLLTGSPISALMAYNAGLVSLLVEEDNLEAELEKVCRAIASKPRGVITLGKKFYQRQLELPLHSAYEEGGQVMADNLQYRDAQEGIKAFIEKRKPNFSHSQETI